MNIELLNSHPLILHGCTCLRRLGRGRGGRRPGTRLPWRGRPWCPTGGRRAGTARGRPSWRPAGGAESARTGSLEWSFSVTALLAGVVNENPSMLRQQATDHRTHKKTKCMWAARAKGQRVELGSMRSRHQLRAFRGANAKRARQSDQ
jgi:hypothetical protein